MRLIHYSRTPFNLSTRRKYTQDPGCFKPVGLWVSVEGDMDWPTWCRAEGFYPERLAYASEIVVSHSSILHIDTLSALDGFTRVFGVGGQSDKIDWPAVCRLWGGIVIAPYQWCRRMEYLWYYSWDCASGCIWDRSIIKEVKRVETAEEAQSRVA